VLRFKSIISRIVILHIVAVVITSILMSVGAVLAVELRDRQHSRPRRCRNRPSRSANI